MNISKEAAEQALIATLAFSRARIGCATPRDGIVLTLATMNGILQSIQDEPSSSSMLKEGLAGVRVRLDALCAALEGN